MRRYLPGALIILATFVIWIALDVWLLKAGYHTESRVLLDWGKRSTFFAFLMGFLMGHWFMPRKQLWASGWMYALPAFGVLIAWDVAWAIWVGTNPWFRFPILWVAVGVPVGSYLWGQPDDDSPL